MVVAEDGEFAPNFRTIAALALQYRLPSIGAKEYGEAGGLIGHRLRGEHFRFVSASGLFRGSHSQRCQAGRPSRRATDTGRPRRQRQDCKGIRSRASTDANCSRRQSDRIVRSLSRCMSPLLALSGRATGAFLCPLSAVEGTCVREGRTSASDPKRTFSLFKSQCPVLICTACKLGLYR